MFENLSDKLDRAFKVLKGQGTITEINVAETMKEIRKALLDADVNYKTAKAFTDDVRQKALGQNVLTAVSPGQLLTKIMNDELAALMGGTATELNLTASPTIILIAGLNGVSSPVNFLQSNGSAVDISGGYLTYTPGFVRVSSFINSYGQIVSASEEGTPARGYFVAPASQFVIHNFILDPNDPTEFKVAEAPPGFREVARNHSWIVYSRCR